MILPALVLCSQGSAQAGPPAQTITIAIAAPPSTTPISVEAVWQGEAQQAVLEPGDAGSHQAELTGPATRYLQISLWQDGAAIYSGVERLVLGDQTLAYALIPDEPLARRVSRPLPPAALERTEAAWIGGSLAWVGLTLAGMLWMTGRSRRDEEPAVWAWWWSPLLWLLLAVAWTWPAASGALTSLHFDALGTIWGLDAAERLISGGLQDPLTGWPLGGDYARFDSFLLLPLGLLGIEAVRLHGIMQVAGVALSAWAAERFALAVGAKAPWSLLAGLLFAFSGLAANVLLEGHAYMLVDPWLPLMGLMWWRALSGDGRVVQGVLTGLAFTAALLSSGYLGLCAAVVAIGLWVGAVKRRGAAVLPATLGAVGVVLPVGIAYLWVFFTHSGGLDTSEASIQLASASLASLAGPTPEVDRQHHSLALALSPVMLSLIALAPALLPRRARWRVLLWSGAAALLMAAGPVIGSRLDASFSLGALTGVRFPIRVIWAVLLCWGALAAWAASAMVQRHGRWAGGVVLALALAESFLLVQMPHRQQTLHAGIPSAYAHSSGAILDFYPEEIDESGERELLRTATDCFYQTGHGLPIADRCVVTPTAENPRVVLGRWLGALLLQGGGAEAVATLQGMGFGAVALHADHFHPGDLARMRAALGAHADVVETQDGGEHIVLFVLAAPADTPQRVLPQAHPPAQIGTAGLAPARSLRIEVLDRDDAATYTAQVVVDDRAPRQIPLSDQGVTAGDLQHDGVRVGLWQDEPAAALSLTLKRGPTTLWQGDVWPGAAADRVVFAVEDGSARPVVAAPAALDRPMTTDNGRAALVGWGGILLIGLLGMLRWQTRR